jgi:hypothetical protein
MFSKNLVHHGREEMTEKNNSHYGGRKKKYTRDPVQDASHKDICPVNSVLQLVPNSYFLPPANNAILL